jgi:hypothetical protein
MAQRFDKHTETPRDHSARVLSMPFHSDGALETTSIE